MGVSSRYVFEGWREGGRIYASVHDTVGYSRRPKLLNLR